MVSAYSWLAEQNTRIYGHFAVAASVILTRYRTKLRRQMNERDVVRSAVA